MSLPKYTTLDQDDEKKLEATANAHLQARLSRPRQSPSWTIPAIAGLFAIVLLASIAFFIQVPHHNQHSPELLDPKLFSPDCENQASMNNNVVLTCFSPAHWQDIPGRQ
jgi:hypothetical protein